VTEVSKGTDHAHGAVTGQALEQFFQGLVGFVVGVAPEGHREFADLFDQLVSLGAFLHTDHVAQDAAQQADVLDQGAFAVAFFSRGAAWSGVGGQGVVWCGLFHRVLGYLEGGVWGCQFLLTSC
jgi:hypothetical protein